jgi:hypothetical protein
MARGAGEEKGLSPGIGEKVGYSRKKELLAL